LVKKLRLGKKVGQGSSSEAATKFMEMAASRQQLAKLKKKLLLRDTTERRKREEELHSAKLQKIKLQIQCLELELQERKRKAAKAAGRLQGTKKRRRLLSGPQPFEEWDDEELI
jgi:hypothetical protein